MAAQHEKDQATMNAKMTALSKENHEEKARLKAEQAAQQEEFDNKMYGLQYQMELTDKEHAKKKCRAPRIAQRTLTFMPRGGAR